MRSHSQRKLLDVARLVEDRDAVCTTRHPQGGYEPGYVWLREMSHFLCRHDFPIASPNPSRIELALLPWFCEHHLADQPSVILDSSWISNRVHGLYRTFVRAPSTCWISKVGLPSLLKLLSTAFDPSDSSFTFTGPTVFSAPASASKSFAACATHQPSRKSRRPREPALRSVPAPAKTVAISAIPESFDLRSFAQAEPPCGSRVVTSTVGTRARRLP